MSHNTSKGGLGKNRSDDQDNLYNYASAPRVADHLERTQTGRFGTKGGTGFAAEDVNAMNDLWSGKSVDQVGKANLPNGADRIVDGVKVQTKYFDSAARTVRAAFDAEGVYRYGDQLLEVPSDQYEKAIELMREKISQGKVPGVSDPDDATKIVKKGSVTYQQARNIARGGNIESLKYDAKNQAVSTGYAFAISFGISYARALWEGKSPKEALKDATSMGLASSATSFIAGVLTAQMMRTTLARQSTVLARHGVKAVAKTELGKKAINAIAKASLGKSVSGAAAINHVSKLLRTNFITGAVTTITITTPDLYRAAVSKSTSWAQVGKNLIVNGAGVGAGMGGWAGGAALGATVGSAIPGVGTAAGAVVGGVVGAVATGTAGSYASKKLLDHFIQDDADEMYAILEMDVLPILGFDFLMSEAEFKSFMGAIAPHINIDFLRQMYAQQGRLARIEFAYDALEAEALEIIKQRPPVALPTEEKVHQFINEMIEAAELAPEGEGVGSDGTESENYTGNSDYKPNFVMGDDSASPSKGIATGKLAVKGLPVTAALLGSLAGRFYK